MSILDHRLNRPHKAAVKYDNMIIMGDFNIDIKK